MALRRPITSRHGIGGSGPLSPPYPVPLGSGPPRCAASGEKQRFQRKPPQQTQRTPADPRTAKTGRPACSTAGEAAAKSPPEPRISTTDAEARVMKMPDGGFRPAFNLGFASDPRSTMTQLGQ